MSKQTVKTSLHKYVPLLLGLRIPGFIRIHGRYARRNLVTWLVLVIAPFIIGMISLSTIGERLLKIEIGGLQLFLITLFLIAAAFFFAERYRMFRRLYVAGIPALIIINGLLRFVVFKGVSLGSLVTFGILAGLPAWLLGRHAMGKGYRLLSDGADKNYRPGRDLYMDGHYADAFTHLEPAARRGHMKSLYLIGHAYEHGKGRPRDRIKAARFYDKAGRKGYRKANLAFEALFAGFTEDEIDAFEIDVSLTGINDLF